MKLKKCERVLADLYQITVLIIHTDDIANLLCKNDCLEEKQYLTFEQTEGTSL